MPKKISQRQLAKLVQQKTKLEELEQQIKLAEDAILAQLKAGSFVQSGILMARIKEWSRRNVAWKEIVVREKGQEYAERVLNATKADSYESLVVELAGG